MFSYSGCKHYNIFSISSKFPYLVPQDAVLQGQLNNCTYFFKKVFRVRWHLKSCESLYPLLSFRFFSYQKGIIIVNVLLLVLLILHYYPMSVAVITTFLWDKFQLSPSSSRFTHIISTAFTICIEITITLSLYFFLALVLAT